jgi:hypothetical protein
MWFCCCFVFQEERKKFFYGEITCAQVSKPKKLNYQSRSTCAPTVPVQLEPLRTNGQEAGWIFPPKTCLKTVFAWKEPRGKESHVIQFSQTFIPSKGAGKGLSYKTTGKKITLTTSLINPKFKLKTIIYLN